MHFDLTQIIQSVGYVGLFAIVYAESGLFFGFFLPGDSIIVPAGLLASQGYFNIWVLIILLSIAAILGDSTGYWTGKKFGRRIFSKEKLEIDGLSIWAKINITLRDKGHIKTAEDFYKKHGSQTIVLARFLPYIRTFAPIVAGIGNMDYKRFLTYNILGGIGWSTSLLLVGYFLGRIIPNVDKYLIPIIIVIVIVSFIPNTWEHRKAIKKQLLKAVQKVSSSHT